MHKKINNLIHLLEDGLLIFTLAAMILLALSQIVLRNVFETGIEWSEPLLRILVLWLGLLGAIAATKKNHHISIDVITRMLPKNGKFATDIINNLFSALVCAVIAYYSTRFVMMEYEEGITAFADVPAWLCESIIPVGFGLMTLRFVINIGCAIKDHTSDKQPKPE